MENLQGKLGKFGPPVVDRGLTDGPENPVRHVGWPWYLKKMTPAFIIHTAPPRRIQMEKRQINS
jgi:hypothetical protein